MRLLILIFLILNSNTAISDSIDFSLASYHFDSNYKYNETNFGVGYTKDFGNNLFGKIGNYKNSYDKNSTYAMLGIKRSIGKVSFSVSSGLITGYDNISSRVQQKTVYSTVVHSHHHKHGKKVVTENKPTNLNKYQFIVLPAISFTVYNRHRLELGLIPSKYVNVLTLQYQFILN